MKSIICLLLLAVGLQTPAQDKQERSGDFKLILTARKLSAVSYFQQGMAVRVVIKDSVEERMILKGYITHLDGEKFIIGSFNNKTEETIISPGAIEKIRPLSRRGRKVAAIILGGGAVYAGIIGLISKPGPLQYVLFIPAMGAGLFFFYYYPVTFLFDLIRQKSTKGGWFFSIERRR